MEPFSTAWLSMLLSIVLIDLVLAGDNAIVIALAARQLPRHLQKRAIVWGTLVAIGVRTLMTVGVVWLLKIPGLMLLGGLGLVWIAYRLIGPQHTSGPHQPPVSTFGGAMRTIVVADALMGVDNVLGIAGAAHGHIDLVVIGLLISVPIVVWGSTLMLGLVERFAFIGYVGAAVLAFTAARMITGEPLLAAHLEAHPALGLLIDASVVSGVLLAGWRAGRRKSSTLPLPRRLTVVSSTRRT